MAHLAENDDFFALKFFFLETLRTFALRFDRNLIILLTIKIFYVMGKIEKMTIKIGQTAINVATTEGRTNLIEGCTLYIPKSSAFFLADAEGKYAHILCAQLISNEVIETRLFMGQVCPTAYTNEGLSYKPYEGFSTNTQKFAKYMRANTEAFFREFGGKLVEVVESTTCNRHTFKDGKVEIVGTREVFGFEVSPKTPEKAFTEWETKMLKISPPPQSEKTARSRKK